MFCDIFLKIVPFMRKRGKTQIHCCVSTATMVKQMCHNIMFIYSYIACLVLTEVRKYLSVELKDDSQLHDCRQITDWFKKKSHISKSIAKKFRATLYNSCYLDPTDIAFIKMLYYNWYSSNDRCSWNCYHSVRLF
jgi:hypothetical protein